MSEVIKQTGSCLCGAVRITANNTGKKVGACHCGMCRKWGGGPFMEVDCSTDISFKGEEAIGVYNSSSWAERGFCKKCGSHLFYLSIGIENFPGIGVEKFPPGLVG